MVALQLILCYGRNQSNLQPPPNMVNPFSTPETSIWEKFDVSKLSNVGFKLDFISPLDCNGEKNGCIKLEDIQSEIEFWNLA